MPALIVLLPAGFAIASLFPEKFAGWDMITHAELPWNDIYCRNLNRLRKTNADIKSQFEFGSERDPSQVW